MKRFKIIKFCLVCFCLISMFGCRSKGVPDEADAFARDFLEILRKGNFDEAINMFDPQFVQQGIESDLQKISSFLDQGDPLSIEIVEWNIFSTKNRKRINITYQYQYKKNSWLLASVVVDNISGKQHVSGANVRLIPSSLKEKNAFTFSKKGVSNYIMIVLAILIPLFILYTLIACIRTKVKKKWLWIIFIIFGIGKFSLNWTTGQIGFISFYVQLFGASVFKSGPLAPWILSISLPLGAILFLIKKQKMNKVIDIQPTPKNGTSIENQDTQQEAEPV